MSIRTASTAHDSKAPVSGSRSAGVLQRQCACGQHQPSGGECEECRKKRLILQRHPAGPPDPAAVPPIVHEVLRSPGRALNRETRAFMEPRFGHDFSGVRIHADARAAESANAVNALAYTVGNDIVFAAGHYAPETPRGRKLVAHELTHVLQQGGSRFALHPATRVSRSDEPAEMEAETAANRIMQGVPVSASTRVRTASLLRQQAQAQESQTDTAEPMTRPEEIRLSRTSPGEVAGTTRPPVISIYNFAIDGAHLKPRHQAALAEVGDLIRRVSPGSVRVLLIGHTDNTGERAVNDLLSRRRAVAAQRLLQRDAGRSVEAAWAGEAQPVDSNATVEGRSRNRRVDIHFFPTGATPSVSPPAPPPSGPPQPPGGERPPGSHPPTTRPPGGPPGPPRSEGDRWFCAQHPILCLAFGAGAAGAAALWFCIQNPLACLPVPGDPGGGGGDGGGEGERQRREPRDRHACPIHTNLPSGTHRAIARKVLGDQYWMHWPFRMEVTFSQSKEGCDCNCGEYEQRLKGFAERIEPDGTVTRSRLRLVGGPLDRAVEREDARAGNPALPYGHRYWDDVTRMSPRPDQEEDTFDPDRETGCEYKGADEPGMTGHTPGQRMRFRFEFHGGPVDACHGRAPVGSWSRWTVWGDHTIPHPTPPSPPPAPSRPPSKPPTPGPSGPQATPQPRVPPPYTGPTIGPAPPPAAPSVFCFGDSIGCRTLDFLRSKQREHFTISEDDVRQAINIEHQLLLHTRVPPPVVDIHQSEDYWAWVGQMKLEARRRVLDFLNLGSLYNSHYAD